MQSPPNVQQQLKQIEREQNPLQHQASGLGGMAPLISQSLNPGFQISNKEKERLKEGIQEELQAEIDQDNMTRKEELEYKKAKEASLLSSQQEEKDRSKSLSFFEPKPPPKTNVKETPSKDSQK